MFDVISRPFGASTSCATARTWSPDRISVPITTRSTSASEASAFRSGASTRKRPATALERTTSDSMPERVVVIASARLNARKSVSASGRRIRNGSTTSRVIVCARAVVDSVSRAAAARSSSAIASADSNRSAGPLGQRPPDHAIDRGDGRRSAERRRLIVHRRAHDVDDRAPAERRASGQHLEQDGAGGEQVAARVATLAADQLRRHVARRADEHPGLRNRGHGRTRVLELGAGQAEVEQLDAMRRDEDVRRLEIAVDDASGMERGQRRQHARADRRRPRHAQRPLDHEVGQGVALEQLHRDEELALVLADLVDLADVGMADAGGRPRLAPEPLARALVARHRRQHLHRHRTPEPFVVRRIHHAHAALAQLAGDRIVPQPAREPVLGGLARRRLRLCARQPVEEGAKGHVRSTVSARTTASRTPRHW